jgi:hypothetical protein
MWVDPSSADLMLSDLTEQLLAADIASLLDVTHLAPARAEDVAWPVRAVLYGVFSRVMVSLVVCAPPRAGRAAAALHVVFLVDTGRPYTFVSQSTFKALRYTDALPRSTSLRVQGVDMTVQPSHSHFADVNVIGTDFLVRARCTLALDFATTGGLLQVTA